MAPKHGEIYIAFPDDPKPRPVIIVSREELNRGNYVVVMPLTTQQLAARWDLANCVPFQAGEFGLDERCVAQAEMIMVLEKIELDLDAGPIGTLDDETMRDVVRALGYMASAECEPC